MWRTTFKVVVMDPTLKDAGRMRQPQKFARVKTSNQTPPHPVDESARRDEDASVVGRAPLRPARRTGAQAAGWNRRSAAARALVVDVDHGVGRVDLWAYGITPIPY